MIDCSCFIDHARAVPSWTCPCACHNSPDDDLPLVHGQCSNPDCTNNAVGFEIDEENLFCPKCGSPLEAD